MNIEPIKILLIEDNPGDIELVKVGFENARIANALEVISDGQQAAEFIAKGEDLPDIILLDINLPKMDGFDVLKVIRETPASENIPVVMLTSSESNTDISKSYQYKANSYISKPVDFNEFMGAIKSFEEFWLTLVKLPSKT